MELLEEIRTKVPPEMLAEQKCDAIVEFLSPGRTQVVPTLIGYGSVMKALGPFEGAAALKALRAAGADDAHPLYWVMMMLRDSNLDMGDSDTRNMVGLLTSQGIFTQEGATALLALAEQPAPLDLIEVVKTCWSDDGEWIV